MDDASRSPIPPAPPAPPATAIPRSPLANRSNLELTSWDCKDSSEGQPSPHDSLYDAGRVSTSDRAKSPYQTATAARPVTPPPLRPIDLDSESPLSRLETPFLYGRGTELAPILEQRSVATLRTASLSASDVSSLMHGAPPSSGRRATNENSNINGGSPLTPLQLRRRQNRLRRKQSFSLDDLPLVYATYQNDINYDGYDDDDDDEESVTTTGLSSPPPPTGRPRLGPLIYAHPTVRVADVHAYPQRPIYPAHQEPRTPPGVARLIERQQQQQQRESGEPAAPSSFRGQRSGHGNMASHPFLRRLGGSSIVGGGGGGGGGSSDSNGMNSRNPHAPPAAIVSSSSASASPFTTGRHDHSHSHQHHLSRAGEPPRAPRANTTATTTLRSRHAARSSAAATHDGSGEYAPLRGPLNLVIPPFHPNANPGDQHPACRSCHRPADAWWSLSQTVAGHGPGARRGGEWCTRCAYRKVAARVWCCCGWGDGGSEGGGG